MQRKQFLKLALLSNLGLILKPSKIFSSPLFNKLSASDTTNVIYYRKNDINYDKLRQGFNKRISKFPRIIALCKNTEGVAEAVLYAKQNNLPIAIKSGGHCMEGFSCNNDGMVINLSLLNKIDWIDKETINIGPACTLSNLYDTLLPKGRIIPGGSCASVGMGGLVLGGGYGLLARKFGLACDSLLEVTMVDGNGQIRNSNDDKELLWACKGGGNGNFGVVTSMKFKTHKAPPTLQSFHFKSYKVSTARAKAILQKWFEVTPNLPVECFSAFVLNGKTIYILLTNAGNHNPGLQKIMDELSVLSDKTTQSKPQPLAIAFKNYYGQKGPVYFKNASVGLYKSFADIENYIEKAIDIVRTTPDMIYQVNTLGGNIVNAQAEAAAAFPHRSCIYFSELQTYWDTENQGASYIKKFEAVQTIFTSNGIHTQYRNYPDINFKNWDTQYYGNNYKRLQQVKNKYDPLNVIRHEQSIRNI